MEFRLSLDLCALNQILEIKLVICLIKKNLTLLDFLKYCC